MKKVLLCLCTLLLLLSSCKQKETVPLPKSNADPKLSVFLSSRGIYPSPNIRTKTYIDTATNTVWGHVSIHDAKDESLDSIHVSIHAEKSPSGSYIYVLDSLVSMPSVLEFDVKAENGSVKHYILKIIRPYIEHEASHYYYKDSSRLVHTLDSVKVFREHSFYNDVFYKYNVFSNVLFNPPAFSYPVYGLECYLHPIDHTSIFGHMFRIGILKSQELRDNAFANNGKELLKLHDARTDMKIQYDDWDEQKWTGSLNVTEQDPNLYTISGTYDLTREFQNRKIVLKGHFKNLLYIRIGDM